MSQPAGSPPEGPAPASAVIIGTGLIGTSVALALRFRGVTVWLADRDPAAARLAADIGAGELLPEGWPPREAEPRRLAAARRGVAIGGSGGSPPRVSTDIAVIAVPPAAVAATLAAAQGRGLARWYTDVASVKSQPLAQARALGCDLASFVPGHPLAGRERSGPAAARADLFLGRPWVVCHGGSIPAAGVATVAALARVCGAEPVLADPAEHDAWVALVSHAPHVVSAAMAARLTEARDGALALAGQGLRDVTRIAAGDTRLWAQILAANAAPVADVLAAVGADLIAVAEELAGVAGGEAPGTGSAAELKLLAALLDQGVAGVARLPGKRGGPARAETQVQVVIQDQPGELARLFQAAGEAGVNIEDVGIEHSPGLPVGVAELTVHPDAVGPLTEALAANGWPVRR
ncbi:MAG TPA: prephenate dehydrogenase [Streptosporangiaceae bacterium]